MKEPIGEAGKPDAQYQSIFDGQQMCLFYLSYLRKQIRQTSSGKFEDPSSGNLKLASGEFSRKNRDLKDA